MPEPAALKVIFDHAQTRLSQHAQTIAMRGLDLDGIGTDVFIDPVTNTTMLRPMASYDDYWTTNTGILTKPVIGAGLEVKTSAKWKSCDMLKSGFAMYACCPDSSGEYVRTDSTVGINRGIFFSGYAFGAGDHFVLWELGWSDSTTPTAETASVGLKVYADFTVDVWVDGEYRGSGKVSGSDRGQAQSANQLVNMYIVPFRRRELLIYSDKGSGFTFLFDEIDEDETAPIITPDTKFFCIPGSAANLQLLIHPLEFVTSATITSKIFTFAEPPITGSSLRVWSNAEFDTVTNALVFGNKAYSSPETTNVSLAELLEDDGATAFVPTGDGAGNGLRRCRIRLTLTGDGRYTPFPNGVIMEFAPETLTTNDSEEFDATDYVLKQSGCTFDVPDDGFGGSFRAELIEPQTIEESVYALRIQTFRPVSIRLGDVTILDGFLKKPHWFDSTSRWTRKLGFEAVPLHTFMEKYLIRGRIPFDGSPLLRPGTDDSAFRYLFQNTGLDLRMVFSDVDYYISDIPDQRCEEWNLASEVGETARDSFEKLHRLCADHVYGPHPGVDGIEFWIKSPADIEATEPVLTLYRSEEDAIAGGVAEEDAYRYVYRNYHEEVLEVEATEVRVTGINPRDGSIIQAYYNDAAAAAVDTAPSNRPDNWCGFPLGLGVTAREVRSTADAERVAEFLLPIATAARKICEWDCPAWPEYDKDGTSLPLWRMDRVILDGIGEVLGDETDDGTRLVSSLSTTFKLETDDLVCRDVHFTGGTIFGRGGTTVHEIQDIARMRTAGAGATDTASPRFLFSSATTVTRVTP